MTDQIHEGLRSPNQFAFKTSKEIKQNDTIQIAFPFTGLTLIKAPAPGTVYLSLPQTTPAVVL